MNTADTDHTTTETTDDIGWPPPGHEPPTAAEWHEPEGTEQ